MLTNAIVFGSLIIALVYFIAWFVRRDFREQIERPKHRFQDQVEEYDSQLIQQENKS
ncbi:MAG: hypothetical protein P8J61_01375 [Gammaproteobacteria bacterium]|jgi:hypothetical protein|nr:hypothetical protein [Gammaproteobacteria bacterium]